MPAFLGQRKSFQEQLLARVRGNLANLDRHVAGQRARSRLAVVGGWYAVLRVPAIRSDEDLAVELLSSQIVYVHLSHFYDFPTDGFLVVSLITPETNFSKGITGVVQ